MHKLFVLLTYKVLLMFHLQNIYEPTQNDAMQCSQLECCVKKNYATL